jgi:hypothetical protein
MTCSAGTGLHQWQQATYLHWLLNCVQQQALQQHTNRTVLITDPVELASPQPRLATAMVVVLTDC